MAVSRLFLYMELTPVVPIVRCMSIAWYLVCVMCEIKSVLCAGSSLCYVRAQACVMCGLKPVLCACFSLCYVRDLVCVLCGL